MEFSRKKWLHLEIRDCSTMSIIMGRSLNKKRESNLCLNDKSRSSHCIHPTRLNILFITTPKKSLEHFLIFCINDIHVFFILTGVWPLLCGMGISVIEISTGEFSNRHAPVRRSKVATGSFKSRAKASNTETLHPISSAPPSFSLHLFSRGHLFLFLLDFLSAEQPSKTNLAVAHQKRSGFFLVCSFVCLSARWLLEMAEVKAEEIAAHPPMDQLQGFEYCIDSNPSWGLSTLLNLHPFFFCSSVLTSVSSVF